ncbi:putative membrane protein [Rhodoligotrophos appendicifer]|uniref:DUF4142 domain-containing protein n=1 Tax=Rhodoligotrophos appendicifer TaxID=987056 RepID=UPI0014780B56|nr:DUF4142 domain-containing protein [Rhodoligotrophos appendicifer]
MRRHLLGSASLALALAWSTAAFAQMDNNEFMAKAIQTNLAEIALGKLSQEKAQDAKVRQYGEMMVKEHTEANAEAEALARSLNLTPPTAPSEDDQEIARKLSGLSGAAFDEEFVDAMVDGHEEAVAMFREQSEATDSVGQFAKKMLPHLEEHLRLAEALDDDADGAENAAVKDPSKNEAKLAPGANSFTEGQAQSRISDMGYTDVGPLKKDENGIWRGEAKKDGKAMAVGVDFQGNVVAE